MPEATELDHVALALPDRAPFWAMFAGDLGGRWVRGAETFGGFAFAQLRFANGMKVEALEPSPSGSDFLVRFLATAGPGAHHLTFKVADLDEAVARAWDAGYRPFGVDRQGPAWKEAFLHPRAASGIVVQLAWSEGERAEPPPAWLPPSRVPAPAELVHVAHAVADLEGALKLFKGLLHGRSVDAGAGGGIGWVDLAWPGAGRLRLMAGEPLGPWLGARPGRLHHLAFRVDSPGGVAGAVEHDGWWEVAPAPPLRTRLVLVEPGGVLPEVAETSGFRAGATGMGRCMPNSDDIQGRVKESAGALTGDDELKREGKADQAAGTIKDKADDVADKVKDVFKKD